MNAAQPKTPRYSVLVVATLAALVLGTALGWFASRRAGMSHEHGAAAAGGAGAAGTNGGAGAGERRVLYWYDPMVPTQKFDKPGKSPFMDMMLVPRYADEGDIVGGGAGGGGGTLAVSPAAQQSLGVRLARAERRPVGAAVEAAGTVVLNERDIAIVQARAAGFVERVAAHAPGDIVAAGTLLAEVLNPEWLAAQQEFLAVRATGDAALAQAGRQRLVLLGMPAAMVEQVERSGQPQPLQAITAPVGGVITEWAVRPGMTLAAGMTLARINGFATVWLEAALPEALAASVRPGQAATARFPALDGEQVKGRVAAILPEAQRETRTLRVRIELPNPRGRLRAGLYAQVSLAAAQREALVLPAEAVIRTGRRALVYLAEPGGRYRPVEVTLGEQLDDVIVVKSGLAEGQQVVASGQFLIDSEASLQGVTARAAPTVPGASGAATAGAAGTAAPPEYRTRGRFVQADATEATLEHEPVPELKWPAMTMPFKLGDKKLAAQLSAMKPGQPLAFTFVKQGDEWAIKSIDAAPAGKPAAAASAGSAVAAPGAGASR